MSRRRPSTEIGPIEQRALQALSNWFEAERGGREIAVGVANGALHLFEILYERYPIDPGDYTSRGGTQVKGLSGRSGDRIIRRFWPGAPSIGTEAGRTSRGTLPAVERLADRLNTLESLGTISEAQRRRLAKKLQTWLVEGPIRTYFERKRLEVALDARQTSQANVAAILHTARERNQSGAVAQHLVGAKLALRFADMEIENYSYTTADVQLKRPGDFVVGDTAFHVTMTPTEADLRKCGGNIRQGYRSVLLVPEGSREAARQMAENIDLAGRVAVYSIEGFVGQNMEELAGFSQARLESYFRQLLETYNERVEQSETDPSLLIEIPANLGAQGTN